MLFSRNQPSVEAQLEGPWVRSSLLAEQNGSATVRAAIVAAYQLGMQHRERTSNGIPVGGDGYLIRWEIDEFRSHLTPQEAAALAWDTYFQPRHAGPEEPCVFQVFNRKTGDQVLVDLSECDTELDAPKAALPDADDRD